MTDNGACYRSTLLNDVPTSSGIKHRWTRPYRPQTNGKVERFIRTLANESAYSRPYTKKPNANRPTPPGSTTTIITDPTPASAAKHHQNAFKTSGNTSSPVDTISRIVQRNQLFGGKDVTGNRNSNPPCAPLLD